MTWEIATLIVYSVLWYSLPALWLVGLSALGIRAVRRLWQPRYKPQVGRPLPSPIELICCFPLLDIKKPASEPLTREEVLAAYRRQAKLFHPDTGATEAAFIALVAERERALRAWRSASLA
jgi:hypothetical protein